MAVVTRYHRLSEENTRPSLDSTGEDEHFLDPHDHDNPSTPSKQKQIKYSFHPTIYLRCVSSFLYLSGGIAMLLSHREQAMPASIFVFIAMGRQLWVPLHHLLTGFLRVRIRNLRIEFRKRGSRITTKEPKNKFPTWLLVGFVQMAIDIVLATLVLGFTAPVPYRSWYYGETLGAKIVVPFHYLSAADLGRGSRLKFEGRITFDKKDDDEDEVNPPSLPVYRDATAAGAGEVGAQSRKAGADSPAMI